MTRIAVDGKALLPPLGGVARYLNDLLAALARLAPPEVELTVLRPERQRRTVPWVLWGLQRASGRGFDVLHCPFYYPPLAPRCPVTVVVHDVLFLSHPEWFPRRRWNHLRWLVRLGVRRAAAVIASAEVNAEAIARLCNVPRRRIAVIPYGVDERLFAPPPPEAIEDARRRHELRRPYLLQVGPFEPRRGVELAIAAVGALREPGGEVELVLAGHERVAVSALAATPPWVRRLGAVGEEELAPLYAGAEVVLAPSRAEGFDLPVLEALASGAAVVASDIAVHLEHFGKAVELFASGDGDALLAALHRVMGDAERRRALRRGGPLLARRFRWEAAARAHIELWREVAG